MLRCIVGLLLLAGLAGCSARSGSPAAKKQPPTPQATAALDACGFNGSHRGPIVMDPG